MCCATRRPSARTILPHRSATRLALAVVADIIGLPVQMPANIRGWYDGRNGPTPCVRIERSMLPSKSHSVESQPFRPARVMQPAAHECAALQSRKATSCVRLRSLVVWLRSPLLPRCRARAVYEFREPPALWVYTLGPSWRTRVPRGHGGVRISTGPRVFTPERCVCEESIGLDAAGDRPPSRE